MLKKFTNKLFLVDRNKFSMRRRLSITSAGMLMALTVGAAPQAYAADQFIGPQVCQLTNYKQAANLIYRQGFIRNISTRQYVTVVCPLPATRESLPAHYMEVVMKHDATNENRNRPFRIVFRIANNLGADAQRQVVLVDKPGELIRLDTTDDEFGTKNFLTSGSINWIPTIQISIPPRSKVISLFYQNRS